MTPKRTRLFFNVLSVAAVLSSTVTVTHLGAQQVAVVDATMHLRLRSKEPAALARGGPLQQSDQSQTVRPELLSLKPIGPKEADQAVFELNVVNKSNNVLEIPIDPHSADFEALLASTGSSHLSLMNVSLTLSDQKANSCVLDGDLKLLGTRAVPKSLVALKPGEWVRIKAPVHVRCGGAASETPPEIKGGSIHAVVSFGTESIMSQNGVLHGTETIQNFVSSASIGIGGIPSK